MTTTDGFWEGKTVFVTGGASFIGSTLTDELLARGAKKVRIVDDLSSGHLGNIRQHLGTGKVDLSSRPGVEFFPGWPGFFRSAQGQSKKSNIRFFGLRVSEFSAIGH